MSVASRSPWDAGSTTKSPEREGAEGEGRERRRGERGQRRECILARKEEWVGEGREEEKEGNRKHGI